MNKKLMDALIRNGAYKPGVRGFLYLVYVVNHYTIYTDLKDLYATTAKVFKTTKCAVEKDIRYFVSSVSEDKPKRFIARLCIEMELFK